MALWSSRMEYHQSCTGRTTVRHWFGLEPDKCNVLSVEVPRLAVLPPDTVGSVNAGRPGPLATVCGTRTTVLFVIAVDVQQWCSRSFTAWVAHGIRVQSSGTTEGEICSRDGHVGTLPRHNP